MEKIRVVIVGARGKKLGEPVGKAIAESEDIVTVAEIVKPGDERPSSWCEAQFHSFAGPWIDRRGMPDTKIHDAVVFYAVKGEDLGDLLLESARADFTKHVIGSTAIPESTEDHIRRLVAEGHTIVPVKNFSPEAVFLEWLLEVAARVLPEHRVGINEEHHEMKTDGPSGTAIALAKAVCRARGWSEDAIRYGWERKMESFPEEAVNIAWQRLGDTVGEHHVKLKGKHAYMVFSQVAQSSQSFAAAALRAVRWTARQTEPGLYGMHDVLGLPKVSSDLQRHLARAEYVKRGMPLPQALTSDAPFCDVCGHITQRNGACYKCLNCGNSMGCS